MHHHKRGFTIIEVSLVLAIAGLILVMAFVALPTLQRQARDSKRKEDTMTFIQALKKYQQNNHGNLPATGNNDWKDQYSIVSSDEDADAYEFYTWRSATSDNNPWANFYYNYLGEDFTNPDNEKYTFVIQDYNRAYFFPDDIKDPENEDLIDDDLFIYLNATCFLTL